jgi:hypothetical protein
VKERTLLPKIMVSAREVTIPSYDESSAGGDTGRNFQNDPKPNWEQWMKPSELTLMNERITSSNIRAFLCHICAVSPSASKSAYEYVNVIVIVVGGPLPSGSTE